MLGRAAASALGVVTIDVLATHGAHAAAFPPASAFSAEVPVAWYDLTLELVRDTPGFSPPVASRALAYAGLTLYESVNPGMDGYRSLADVLPRAGELPRAGRNRAYDWPTVANAGLASALRGLLPAQQAESVTMLERRFERQLQRGLPPGVFERSVARGHDVAAAVLEWARDDGGHEGYLRNFPPYSPPTGPSFWVPTPPGFQPALQPYWGNNRCLAIGGGSACAPGDHPPYAEAPGTDFYAQAYECYRAVLDLTPEQEAIARFWSDDPGQTATPPGHSVSITTQVVRNEGLSLAAAAEAYAKVGMAVCDAFIACWNQKFVYNLVRPVTYIQRLIDATWSPLLVTPPFPEYPSGHSVQSGAAFQVLTDLFGDAYAFTDHTHAERGLAPRAFGSFLEAAHEAAISRLYGGIHYRAAIDNGVEQGRCIGRAVSELPFRG